MGLEELFSLVYTTPASVEWKYGQRIVSFDTITVHLDALARRLLYFYEQPLSTNFTLRQRQVAIQIMGRINCLNHAAKVDLLRKNCFQRMLCRVHLYRHGDAAACLSEHMHEVQNRFKTFTEEQYLRAFPDQPLPDYPAAFTRDGKALYRVDDLPLQKN